MTNPSVPRESEMELLCNSDDSKVKEYRIMSTLPKEAVKYPASQFFKNGLQKHLLCMAEV